MLTFKVSLTSSIINSLQVLSLKISHSFISNPLISPLEFDALDVDAIFSVCDDDYLSIVVAQCLIDAPLVKVTEDEAYCNILILSKLSPLL